MYIKCFGVETIPSSSPGTCHSPAPSPCCVMLSHPLDQGCERLVIRALAGSSGLHSALSSYGDPLPISSAAFRRKEYTHSIF